MANILCSGSAGFIGSHLCDKLIELGHEVIGLDDLSTGNRRNLNSKVIFYEGSILDNNLLNFIFSHHKISYVYHLAAQINLRESIKNPKHDAEINIIGSINLINESVKNKIEKFIFVSTAGAIYNFNGKPNNELDLPQPTSPYGLNKYYIEKFLEVTSQIHGLNYQIFRLANIFGPRQNAHGECGVISIFLDKINNNLPLKIFGNGEQTRDFLDIWSTISALILGISTLESKNIYNVSSNIQVSINEIVSLLKLKYDIKIEYHPPIVGEMLSTQIDNNKLLQYGWKPVASFEEALNKTIKEIC